MPGVAAVGFLTHGGDEFAEEAGKESWWDLGRGFWGGAEIEGWVMGGQGGVEAESLLPQ